MPTFIDESGDTGLVDLGGKPYFRLAAVWVPTLDDAEAFRISIRQLRQRLGLHSNYEFKFAKTHGNPERRREFYLAALASEFRFTICSIDKTVDPWKTAAGAEQHWACATCLAVNLRALYLRAEAKCGAPLREPVVVDSNSDGRFLEIIRRQFRGLGSRIRPGTSLIGKVSFRRSAPDEMLQLADMICGAVGAYLDGEDRTWYEFFAERSLGMDRCRKN